MKRSRAGKAKAAGKGPQAVEPLAGEEAQRLRALIESAEGVHTLGGEELLRALKADRPCDSKSCKVGGGSGGAGRLLADAIRQPTLLAAPVCCSKPAMCCVQLNLLPHLSAAPTAAGIAGPPTACNRLHGLPTGVPLPLPTRRRARLATPTACATWCRRLKASARPGCGHARCGLGAVVLHLLRQCRRRCAALGALAGLKNGCAS